jgi:hypothetical protein
MNTDRTHTQLALGQWFDKLSTSGDWLSPRPLALSLSKGAVMSLSKGGVLTAPFLLAACASVPPITEQPGDAPFGEANRQTMMAQVVNPDPVYDGPIVTSGEHAQQAIERYATDSVKQPESISTTESLSGGGGGGGGSN